MSSMFMGVILDNASLSLELVLLLAVLSLIAKSVHRLLYGIMSGILSEIMLLLSVMVFRSTTSIWSGGKTLHSLAYCSLICLKHFPSGPPLH